jgi:hypothetical protein
MGKLKPLSPQTILSINLICLKELRETCRALRLILAVPLTRDTDMAKTLLIESEELIRIFMASIRTAEKRGVREDPPEWNSI